MANFNLYKQTALKFEGGYQKLSSDPGNYNSRGDLVGTNMGIAATTYEKWLNRPPTVEDMKSITVSIASEIYKSWYWDTVRASEINSQAVVKREKNRVRSKNRLKCLTSEEGVTRLISN